LGVEVAVEQGVKDRFREIWTAGLEADFNYAMAEACSGGDLVYLSSEGQASRTSGGHEADVFVLGFVGIDAAVDTSQIWGFQYTAKIATEKVPVWRKGQFYVTNVVGSITAGARVYPGTVVGSVSATQTGSAPAIGRCIKANSVSGGPVIVEINLLAGP